MKLKAPLILASQSPRRSELLRGIGLDFEVQVRPVDEFFPDDIHPKAVAVLIAEHKAKAYDDLARTHIVITADTIVSLDQKPMGKPADEAEALQMLRSLSGQQHYVYTGVTIFFKGKFKSFAEETLVHFRKLSEEEMLHYVRTFQPYDKAGAYGIQEWIGMVGITRIEGDYYNVMGLPLCRLYEELKQID
jgi:septum formation protein